MMPVNMRGPVEMRRDTDNHASFTEIISKPGDSPMALHSRIRRALNGGQHWFMWQFFQTSSALLGPAWRLRLITLQNLSWTERLRNG
jgi:hypothetical protein